MQGHGMRSLALRSRGQNGISEQIGEPEIYRDALCRWLEREAWSESSRVVVVGRIVPLICREADRCGCRVVARIGRCRGVRKGMAKLDCWKCGRGRLTG